MANQLMIESLLALHSSAVISDCTDYRYRLDREVQERGLVFAFFGVNGSTAGPVEEDQTTKKWRGFTLRNGGCRYIAANPFGYRAKDVRRLAEVDDPVGPENARYLREIIAEADILVPCWGSRDKIPERLRHHLDDLRELLFASGKPIKVFGFTSSGDPKHPLMLGYDTPLVDWPAAIAPSASAQGGTQP
ncbi:DUF1643 domain-containing protein [Aminobacter ciceronei]|uniref:DUF1643 domain-containing protein n=1 Tax=Aminobacter ciceronei TaxID=150723 RepID=A0ABR6C1K1_9HYPH|nr:DUF1643 domain-containing protein [Aminobacter ciceronei]MBA8904849.1 hypothetical protein [Aminobacter ciceronei]MBA9018597.1 hypothetical protein [Aminobacter ciceronei]